MVPGSGFVLVLGAGCWVRSSGFGVRGSGLGVRGSKFGFGHETCSSLGTWSHDTIENWFVGSYRMEGHDFRDRAIGATTKLQQYLNTCKEPPRQGREPYTPNRNLKPRTRNPQSR